MKSIRRSALTLLMILATVGTKTLEAAADVWTNVGPQGAGAATVLAVDPQNPRTVYAGTGVGVLKSQDGGTNWSNAGLSGFSVTSLAIDPQNPSIVYAYALVAYGNLGIIASGVFKSIDGATSWRAVNSKLPVKSYLSNALAIDPQNPSTIYAGDGGGIFKSTDGGESWNATSSGLPTSLNSSGFSVAALAINPQNTSTLYAAVPGCCPNNIAGVFKSTNGGASWSAVNSGLRVDASSTRALAIDPQNPSTLYAGVGGTIFKTTNGGASWSVATDSVQTGEHDFLTLAIDPRNTNTIYAGARIGGVLKSTDQGVSWSAVNIGLPADFMGAETVFTLAIDPQNAATIYEAGGDVFKSTDGGASWKAASSGLRNTSIYSVAIDSVAIDSKNPSTLYEAAGRVSKSTDGGASWGAINSAVLASTSVTTLAIDPLHPAILYGAALADDGGPGGVFKSIDGGESWSAANSGLPGGPDLSVSALAIDPQSPSIIYAVTSTGAFKSLDGGATWGTENSGLPADASVVALAIAPQNPNILYAGTGPLGIFTSTDGGLTWRSTSSALAQGAGQCCIYALAVDPQNSSTVYAATANLNDSGGGLWKSTDGGASWRNLFPSSLNGVYAVTVNPQHSSTIYAGTGGSGLFKSTDGGENWIRISGGPNYIFVLALAPQDPNKVYAGGPEGLFAISFAAAPPPFSAEGQALSASGGSGSLNLAFPADYFWAASTNADWLTFNGPASGTGNGTLNFQVTSNAGPERSATITVAGFSFTIEQQAGSIPGLNFIGSIPHGAAEENWTTTFTLVNKGTTQAQTRLSFFGDPGSPLQLPLIFPQQQTLNGPLWGASLDRTLLANASLVVETAGSQTPLVQIGSAQLAATGPVDGFAILHHLVTQQETVLPLEVRNSKSYVLAFDNTNGVVLGVALQNISGQAANIPVVIRDDNGVQIGPPGATISLAGSGHTSFLLSDPVQGFPVAADKSGTIEFDTPAGGQISALGIRFTPPDGHFTSIPALPNVGTSGGSIAHLASGAGWQTTFVLVNTSSNAAQATISFFADNGSPLSLPLSSPQSGNSATTVASFVTQTLPSGATFTTQSAGSVDLLTGSAQLSTTGNVSGFAIFRHNGQEFAIPFESHNASGYILAFDNTNGTGTAVAINSVSSQMANIPVTVRDDTGALIAMDTIPLAANGHYAFTLATDRYPATKGIRGTIEFDTQPGGQIGVLAIRVPVAHTFTSLPALAK